MSVQVLKIPHSLTEIVKKLKEWNQKEAAWVFSFLLPLRTYKYKCGKAEDDALKCPDHSKFFFKGTAEPQPSYNAMHRSLQVVQARKGLLDQSIHAHAFYPLIRAIAVH